MSETSSEFDDSLQRVFDHIRQRHHDLATLPTLSPPQIIQQTIASLPSTLPDKGKGTSETTSYLINTLLPGILQAQNGPRYFGFVVGGVTEAAQLADVLSGSYDENVQVTLPGVTASTAIESRTLELVLDLLDISRGKYTGRTITTGATASNVLGLGESSRNIFGDCC
jgi:glutamate/tyrosine decarboxylase-like PLP-dependent enzyme